MLAPAVQSAACPHCQGTGRRESNVAIAFVGDVLVKAVKPVCERCKGTGKRQLGDQIGEKKDGT